MKNSQIVSILLLSSILFIIYLTILPEPRLGIGVKGGVNFIPFRTMGDLLFHSSFKEFVINNIGNIILFIPFGFFLPLKFNNPGSWKKVCLIGMLLSMTIECIQLFLPNRWTDIDDVILNTVGTGIGYCLFNLISRLLKMK
ncbi:VanZ family protein [Priestia megaterium]|uniref:VanZ family protein n=1 Tax=Priestia megaterium TaxID=1404 RepID=UPI003D97765B